MDGRESTLITRTQKQHITQNVSAQKTVKVSRKWIFFISGDDHDKNDPRSAVYRARRPAHWLYPRAGGHIQRSRGSYGLSEPAVCRLSPVPAAAAAAAAAVPPRLQPTTHSTESEREKQLAVEQPPRWAIPEQSCPQGACKSAPYNTGWSGMNNLSQLCTRFSDCARQMWNRMT